MAKRYSRTAGANIPMCIAAVMLCLTMISVHLTCGLYAKYTTSGESSDGARVIRFGELKITEDADFYGDNSKRELIITPGVNLKKDVKVSFTGSEASTYVFIEIILSNGWNYNSGTFSLNSGTKSFVSWKIADGWTYHKHDNEKNSYVFYRELAPNKTLDVPVIAGKDTTYGVLTVDERITKSDLSQDLFKNLHIDFKASVVQSNGFDSVADAWSDLN